MKKVRYGIVGVGKQGSMYARRLAKKNGKDAELVAICDILEERRDWAKKTLKGVKVYSDYKEMIDKNIIDAVLIEVPHYFHCEIAKYAISNGVHTLVDKPIAVFTKDARELNEFAEKYPDTAYGIMYNQRTNPLYKRAKELIDNGTMGSIKRVNWVITDWYRSQTYYDQGSWRGTWNGEGGGVLINQCPHQLDLIQWLVGMPTVVRGNVKVGVNRDIAVENDVTAYFEYESGATGVFITSTHDLPGANRLEIDCDGGQIIIDKKSMTVSLLDEKESVYGSARGEGFMKKQKPKVKKYKLGTLGFLSNTLWGQHFGVINAFTSHILHGTPMIANGYEGINGLTIGNSIMLSSWLKEDVVLPIDEEAFLAQLEKRKEEENATLAAK